MSADACAAVFTTLPWQWGSSGLEGEAAHCRAHLQRLLSHANRMGIRIPQNFGELISSALQSAMSQHGEAMLNTEKFALLRIELQRNGTVNCRFRPRSPPLMLDTSPNGRSGIAAKCVPWTTRWGLGVAGCKHGEWQPYLHSMTSAKDSNAACGLLVTEDGSVVDGSHVTPLVTLPGPHNVGKVFYPDPDHGAVESVTLNAMRPFLEASGLTPCASRLTVTDMLNATEMVVVGSGAGALDVLELLLLDGTVHRYDTPTTYLFKKCTEALGKTRVSSDDGWRSWQSFVEMANNWTSWASAVPFHWRSMASTEVALLLKAAEHLRAASLYGTGAVKFGGPDELLLISGGPCSDVCRFSMLAGPSVLRYRAHQPTIQLQPDNATNGVDPSLSALDGHLKLEEPAAPLDWVAERWDSEQAKWVPDTALQINGMALGTTVREMSTSSLPCYSLGAGLPVNVGTLAGHLGYDLFQWTQPLRAMYPAPPGTLLGILYNVQRWVIQDRSEGVVHVIAPPGDPWATKCKQLLERLDLNDIPPAPASPLSVTSPHSFPTADSIPKETSSALWSTTTDEQHADRVERVKQCIRDGHLYQLNYARRWFGSLPDALNSFDGPSHVSSHEPWEVMRRLVARNPAPFGAWLFVPDLDFLLISCSPELLLMQDDRRISTRPIKGTNSRGTTQQEDMDLIRQMVQSEKETAEHLMLVDLERNDLGRICYPGTVRWSMWRVESYPNVHHLVSEVMGELRPDCDGLDALEAIFPGGSITGCPKTATIAAIEELEKDSRQAWTGSIGFYDAASRKSTWSILIRTLQANRHTGVWHTRLLAGGGLTIGSDPLAEVHECKLKALAIAAAGWGDQGQDDLVGTTIGAGLRQRTLSRIIRDNIQIIAVPSVDARVDAILQGLRREQARCRATVNNAVIMPCTVPFPPPANWSPKTGCGQPRVMFVDNLDSFSWNIISNFAELGTEVFVVPGRCHEGHPFLESDLDYTLHTLKPTHIVIGPGPGRPEFSPLSMALADRAVRGTLASACLGICLGHQCLGMVSGYEVAKAPSGPVHGVPDFCTFDPTCPLFQGMSSPCIMTRYHSLVTQNGPSTPMTPVSWTGSNKEIIMAIQHCSRPVWGVQFHPESAGSHEGHVLMKNFLGAHC